MLRITLSLTAVLSVAVYTFWPAESSQVRGPRVDPPAVTTFDAAANRYVKVLVANDVVVYARPGDDVGMSLLHPRKIYWVHDEQHNDDVSFVLVASTTSTGPTIGWVRRDQLSQWVGSGAIRPRTDLRIWTSDQNTMMVNLAASDVKVSSKGEIGYVKNESNLALPVLGSRPLTVSGKQYRVVNVALVDLEKPVGEEKQVPPGAASQLDIVMVLPLGPNFGTLISRASELLTALETSHDLRVGVVVYGSDLDRPLQRVLDSSWRKAVEELHSLPAQTTAQSGAGFQQAVAQAVAARWANGASRLMIVVSPQPMEEALSVRTLEMHRIDVLRLFSSLDGRHHESAPNRDRWLHLGDPAVDRAVGSIKNLRSLPNGIRGQVQSVSADPKSALPTTGWCMLPEEEFIAIEQTLMGRAALDELLRIIGTLRVAVRPGSTTQERQLADDESIWTLPGTLDAILAAKSMPTAFNSSLKFTREELRRWVTAGDNTLHQRLADVESHLVAARDRVRWFVSGHEQWGFVPTLSLP